MKCDTIYGITIPPKKAGFCDKCGGKLIKRKDDTAPLIKKRLKVYHNVTEPVIDYFKKQNKVVSVDASKPVGVAFKQIIASLK